MTKLSKSDLAHVKYSYLLDAIAALKDAHEEYVARVRSGGEFGLATVKIHGPVLSNLLAACERAKELQADPFRVNFLEKGTSSPWSVRKKCAVVRQVKGVARKYAGGTDPAPGDIAEAIDAIAQRIGMSGTDSGTVQKWCNEYWGYVDYPE